MVDFSFDRNQPPGLLGDLLDQSEAGGGRQPEHAGRILTPASPSHETEELATRYAGAAHWLWYTGGEVTEAEAPLFHERRRLCLSVHAGRKTDLVEAGSAVQLSVLMLPAHGVGVATAWIDGCRKDPWKCKDDMWHQHKARWHLFDALGLQEGRLDVERHYPFLAVQLDAEDLDSYRDQHAEEVATWLTGGYEQDSPEHKRDAVAGHQNLSWRSYERLFMRWTDALALYRRLDDREEYELAKLRAAQLFEYCILTRRLFRSEARRVARRFRQIGAQTIPVVAPGWREANQLLVAFTQAELELVTAPPVASVEAQRLVEGALARFGIPDLINDTRASYQLLDQRVQWIRTQWLAVIAVFAFVLNIVIAVLR